MLEYIRIRAGKEFVYNTISLWVIFKTNELPYAILQEKEGSSHHGTEIPEYEAIVKKEAFYHNPTFNLTPENAQELMDSLWAAGIRPTEGSGSAGSMLATQKHLEDMRTIAFSKINIDKTK